MTEGLTEDGYSAYDASVPYARGLDALRDRLDELRPHRAPGAGSLGDIREVIVVASSSRGGSSLFGELLRRTPGLLHLHAEINPFFALAGLYPVGARRQVLDAEVLAGIGRHPRPDDRDDPGDERLVHDVVWRLLVQWPVLAERLALRDLIERVRPHLVGTPDNALRAAHLEALRSLQSVAPEIDPWYYDLPGALIEAAMPGRPVPSGPPGPAFVEMPPFVALGRWQPATTDELRTLPLVLTTPRNSFRLDFFRHLFPNAQLRVIHLTRNPAGSVNGLVDGWLHHGFFNCVVPDRLHIAGYSDVVPGGERWWCYDLPPGWGAWTDRHLTEVCAFQWQATHAAVLDHLQRTRADSHRVRFESLVASVPERRRVLAGLATWLPVDPAALDVLAAKALPVVMATAPPSPQRWRRRAHQLLPALRAQPVAALGQRLGYGDEATWV